MDIQMDLRNLPAPEPAHRILDALDLLQPGQCLEALMRPHPASLLPMLGNLGYGWRIDAVDSGDTRVTIWRGDDTTAPARAGYAET